MSSGYSVLYAGINDIYTVDCPIQLIKYQIIFDIQASVTFARFRFASSANSADKWLGLYFDCTTTDEHGNPIATLSHQKYVAEGGADALYPVNDRTRRITVAITRVVYADGRVLDIYNPVLQQVSISQELLKGDYAAEIEQLLHSKGITRTNNCDYAVYPSGAWQCSCGMLNGSDHAQCLACGVAATDVAECFCEEALQQQRNQNIYDKAVKTAATTTSLEKVDECIDQLAALGEDYADVPQQIEVCQQRKVLLKKQKRSKKTALIIVACVIVAIIIAISAVAGWNNAENRKISLLALSDKKDGGYTVTNVAYRAEAVTIPATYKGTPITAIGNGAFEGNYYVSDLVIPASVTSIGADAFKGSVLHRVIYLGTMQQWLAISFENEYSNPVNGSATLEIAGETVADVDVPDGVTDIGAYAFYGYNYLRTISLPDSVTSIGKMAFAHSSLTQLQLPATVNNISERIVEGCENLNLLSFSEMYASLQYYGAQQLTDLTVRVATGSLPYSAFADSNVAVVHLPADLSVIPNFTFNGCASLVSLILPQSITVIGQGAFEGCTALTTYYDGTAEQWEKISVAARNAELAPRVCVYSEQSPTSTKQRAWHYSGGVRIEWPMYSVQMDDRRTTAHTDDVSVSTGDAIDKRYIRFVADATTVSFTSSGSTNGYYHRCELTIYNDDKKTKKASMSYDSITGNSLTIGQEYYLYVDSYIGSVTVTLSISGGWWVTEESFSTDYTYLTPGTTYALPTPTREGYVFEGWYDGDTKVDENYTATADVTLSVHWRKLADVSVSFIRDFEQSTFSTQDIQTDNRYYFYVSQAGDITVSLYKSTSNSSSTTVYLYDSKGKQLDSKYLSYSSYSTQSGTISYTATARGIYYLTTSYTTVSATLSGSASPLFFNEYCDQTVVEAVEGTVLDLPTPTRVGQAFLGWYLDGERLEGDTITVPSTDVYLYALWEDVVQITLDYGYANAVAKTSVRSKSVSSAQNTSLVCAKTGVVVLTTSAQASLSLYQDGVLVQPIPAEDCIGDLSKTVAYALEKGVTYTLSSNTSVKVTLSGAYAYFDDGTYAATSVIYAVAGSTIDLPTPSRDNQVFLGWYGSEGKVSNAYTVPDGDVALTAQWPEMVNVTYDYGYGCFEDTSVKTKTLYNYSSAQLKTTTSGSVTISAYNSAYFSWDSATLTLTDGYNTLLSKYIYNSSSSATVNLEAGQTYTLRNGSGSNNIYVTITGGNAYFVSDSLVSTETEAYGIGYTIDLPTLSRSGYTFEGWQVSGVDVGSQYTVAGAVTLTAVWSQN